MTGHVLGDEANSTHYCAMLQVKNTDGKCGQAILYSI